MGAVGLEPTVFVSPVKSRVPSPLGEHSRKSLDCQGAFRKSGKLSEGGERSSLSITL